MPADSESDQKIAQAIQDVSTKAQLLVREEIELAKTEIELKVKSLARGAIIGVAAGIFVLTGMLFALHGLAWLAWYEIIPEGKADFFWGFFILAGALFLLGAFAGWLASRLFKKGTPPAPTMAIEEAQRIREAVQSSSSDDGSTS